MCTKMNNLIVLPSRVVGSFDSEMMTKNEKILVTHDGRFHCDDAFAIGLLLMLEEYKDAIVVRTRNEELIKQGAVIVDVGGIYDEKTLRFDHHQKSFMEYFDAENPITKMSSVGLVYKYHMVRHFGKTILLQRFGINPEYVELIFKLLYKSLIEAIDAIDNGVGITPKGVEPLYRVSTDLSSRVARLNPDWTTWDGHDLVQAKEFTQAIQLAMEEFTLAVLSYRDSFLPCRRIVEEAYETRYSVDSSGRIIVLNTGCPFEVQLDILEEAEKTTSVKDAPLPCLVYFVIYPNDSTQCSWRVKAVRANKNTFELRLPLPQRYCGLRGTEIDLPGINFVHHSGFLAGTSSKESAIALAQLTLKEASDC